MGDPFGKAVRKCFMMLFDNTSFMVALFITLNVSAPYVIGLFLLLFLGFPTRLLAFGSPLLLLPGPASSVLLLTVAFKLRLYKYDFLEKQQQSKTEQEGRKLRRARIPWDALLAEDRELVGVRTIRGMIFPWKE